METMLQTHAPSTGTADTPSVIVATDGLPQSRGAIDMARAIADRLNGTMRVIAVHQSVALTAPDGQVLYDPDVTASLRADLTRRVREQCTRDGVRSDDCEILNGDPARVISEVADGRHSRFIVLGIGRHQLVDRIFGDETALKVARLSHVPVLAVPDGPAELPRHAIVGLDFSEGSVRAAQATLRLLQPGGVLELVHVVPRERLLVDAWVSQEEYMHFVRHSVTRFRARLSVPGDVRVEEMVLSGDPAKELLTYAQRIDADLIAAGSHGHGFATRLVIGSVTTKLLRSATCAVLVTPPDVDHTDRLGAGANATLTIDPAHWSQALDDFTRRNTGRRTQLELDDPELGAQPQEGDYPLLGVTFDRVDHRVEIMLGDLGAGEPHLSRSIGDVDAVNILTNGEGQDVALRLRHGEGQTILTLIR
jgi:nucleotide-binding universal stress UspA family protein